MTHGLYKDLFEKIATAQEELLKHCVEANTVIINGRKYAKLAREVELCRFGFTPMIFGYAMRNGCPAIASATSSPPAPIAIMPMPPLVGVCESDPSSVFPGMPKRSRCT